MDQAQSLWRQGRNILTSPRHSRWICPILIAADAAICALILTRVSYTEIDWRAYMQQVETILRGERDYQKIKGQTGPLVYPAGHVYIYTLLYYLTDHGSNIARAQVIFAGLYLCVLTVVMACYRLAKVPPYVFTMLILSKRLHSIFMLRMFNDCFAIAVLFIAIYLLQKRKWAAGAIAYSTGLSIKMNLLLPLPAIGIILLQAVLIDQDYWQFLSLGSSVVLIQIILGLPFLLYAPMSYFNRAFDFSRVFLWQWTVNWRFVGKDIFLSKEFALGLLVAHLSILLIFIGTRWLTAIGLSVDNLGVIVKGEGRLRKGQELRPYVNPDFVLTSVLTANIIGMLCARSLHYQFYSWLAWATPFLLYRSGLRAPLQFVLWASQEWAWNKYPSSSGSSMTVVVVLAVTVVGVWFNTSDLKLEKERVQIDKQQHR